MAVFSEQPSPASLSEMTTAAFVMRNLSTAEEQYCSDWRQYQNFRLWIDVFIVGPTCLAGLIGNTLAIIMMRIDNANKMVSFLLKALALADNAYLMSCLLLQTLKAISECTNWIPSLESSYPYAEPYIWPFASITQTTAVWVVVLVTADRYLAICKPFEKAKYLSSQKTRIVIFLIPLLATIYNIPRFFERYTTEMPDYCLERNRILTRPTSLRTNRHYVIFYKTGAFFVFRMIIPLLTLTVLNCKLISTLKIAKMDRAMLTNSNQSNINRSRSRKDSFTLILVSVVSVFILCQTPDFLVRLIVSIRRFNGMHKPLTSLPYSYATTCTNMLLTLNSSINCVIYCITGKRFRHILRRVLCGRCPKTCKKSARPYDPINGNSIIRGRASMYSATVETNFSFKSVKNETPL